MRATRLLVIAAVFAAVAAGSSSASSSLTTVFKGRFVCGDRPLAEAQVQLLGAPRTSGSGGGLWGWIAPLDAHPNYTVRGTTYADAQGQWSFRVPRTKSVNYYLRAVLDDGRGTIVTDYPSTEPAAATPGSGGTNFDNVPLQDYHTQSFPGGECRVWLALKDASASYAQLMGKRPPHGNVVAEYGAPNRGVPFAAYTTIVWPRDYFADGASVRHEFWHTIRNASLGSEGAFLDEVSQRDFRLRGNPCTRTTTQYAFHEGWAEFWAGDFSPAPNCNAVKPDDAAVEGNVAWTLTRLERSCGAAANRKRMVDVLLSQGKSIHSLADFVRALGIGAASCLTARLDPTAVPRTKATPPVSDQLWSHDIRSRLDSVRKRESPLKALLPGADRAAAGASCTAPPCLQAIERKLAPSLIRGQLAQAHKIVTALQTEMSIDASSVRGRPTRRFVESITKAPIKLAEAMKKIAVDSIYDALAAARPLATRDHSSRTQSVLQIFRAQHSSLVRTGSTIGHTYHAGWSWGCYWIACWPGWSEESRRTTTVPTVYSHALDFTSSDETRAISFGSAAALGFRGALPKYVCPSGPDLGVHDGWAVAPMCAASDVGAGFRYTGMLVKLTYPARAIFAWVGATRAIPGGLPVQVDAFDASGAHVLGTSVLVGSSTNGAGNWESQLVSLRTSLHAHAIAYVALYVNTPISPGFVGPDPARLAIDRLGYEERPR